MPAETVRADAGGTTPRGRETSAAPRGALAAVALLAIVAIALPVDALARQLAGGADPDHFARVRTGVWMFKALLLAHAVLGGVLAWATRTPPAVRAVLPPHPRTPRPRWLVPLLAALLGLAGVVRVIQLDAGLWFDEITTLVEHVRAPMGDILSRYGTQNQHPLYTLLVRASFALFGEGAAAQRLPAVLLGVGSLATLYLFAVRVAPRREALLVTALLTLSYHHVWFSQNARGYTGLMLFALAGTALLIDLLRRDRWRGWGPYMAYAAVMALGVYTHLTAAFVVLTHAAVVGVLLIRRPGILRPQAPLLVALVLAGTFSLQLYAFVLPQMPETLFFRTSTLVATEWKSPFWLLAETVRGLSRGLPGGWAGLLAGSAVALAGTASWYRRSPAVLALMLLPPLLMAGILVATHHNLWPRFFFFAAGFAALIAVRGVFAITAPLGRRGPAVATGILAVLILISAVSMPRAWGPKQDYRAALEYIEASRQPGDAVAVAGMARIVYDWYLPTAWSPVRTAADLEQVEANHARTWMVYTVPNHLKAGAPEVAARIETAYREVIRFPGTLGDGAIRIAVNR